MKRLTLISQSPRRISLLSKYGIVVSAYPHTVDENAFSAPICSELVELLATKKLESYLHTAALISGPVLAADTMIYFNGKHLGKPLNRSDCKEILMDLSGQSHEVWTGLALFKPGFTEIITRSEKTIVEFHELTMTQIEWYLDQNEWHDAAAGYKIQEKGELLVKSIHGSFSNVVGLPISLVYEMIPELF